MNLTEDQDPVPKPLEPELDNNIQPQPQLPTESQIPQTDDQSNFELLEKEDDPLGPSLDDEVIQERIQKLVKAENLADITMPGYVIKLIRLKGPMTFGQLIQEISKCFEALRRADGSRYTGDIFKALKGCLSSGVFIEETEGFWTINEREAVFYEDRTTQKIKSILIKQGGRFLPQEEEQEEENANGNQILVKKEQQEEVIEEQENSSPPAPKKKAEPKKKPKAENISKKSRPRNKRRPEEYQKVYDVLRTTCKIYKSDDKTRYLIKNPFATISGSETKPQLMQKFGKDKLHAMLACFDFFFPLLEDYMNLKTNDLENVSIIEEEKPNSKIDVKSENIDDKAEEIVETKAPENLDEHCFESYFCFCLDLDLEILGPDAYCL